MRRFMITAAVIASVPAQQANAQWLDEVRVGISEHNICVLDLDCDNADKEKGPNVTGELVFASPDVFRLILSPRPFMTGSLNTAGKTSYVGGGLMWTWDFAPGWAFEPSFAYALHDGAVESGFPQGDPRGDAFSEVNVLFGSRDLFRTGLALNRDLGKNWGVQLQYDHLSHGEILGEGKNQGLDNIGVRAYWRFGN